MDGVIFVMEKFKNQGFIGDWGLIGMGFLKCIMDVL